jgi:hypothetical protein
MGNNMNIFSSIADKVVKFIGNISWKQTNPLTEEEKQEIRKRLTKDYYIILTRSNNHLSTYAISFANFVLTGKFSYWGHALMNFEDKVSSDADFRLMQATRAGVAYATFDEVFNTNSVVLLKPANMNLTKWTKVLDKAKTELGKPYDTLYDLSNDQALSCVELVRTAMQASPTYAADFECFEHDIKDHKNLTPEMFYTCKDFTPEFEIRH